MKTTRRSSVAALLIAVATFSTIAFPSAHADTIDWGYDLFPTNSIDSTGTDLDASYTFYLGAFNGAGGLTPTSSNTASWATHWTTFDSTSYNVGLDYFRSSNNFDDNATFAIGEQAYIWGTNAALGADGEWILIEAAGWQFPSGEAIDPTTHEFFLSDGAVSTVVGTVEAGGTGLQTEAVPEPASALFFSVSAIWFLFRRRRRVTT